MSLEDILSDGKVPKLRWEYAAKIDLLAILYTESECVLLYRRSSNCHSADRWKSCRLHHAENARSM